MFSPSISAPHRSRRHRARSPFSWRSSAGTSRCRPFVHLRRPSSLPADSRPDRLLHAHEGVAVELVNSPAPAAAASALLEGTIDLTWGGPMRVMKARDQNDDSPLACFCEVAARDPFFLVGRGARFRLTDLPALRLATVSEVPTPWLCLQQDLREHGLDPDR